MKTWTRIAAALAGAAAATAVCASVALASDGLQGTQAKKAFFDVRQTPAAKAELRNRLTALDAAPSAALTALRDSLGQQGLVTLDPLTATPRMVGRLDGFLTGPSDAAATDVALGYARTNAVALGLGAGVLDSLSLRKDYVSIDGTHHLSFVQTINGVPVFGNGLRANVTSDGRLINLVGSPVGSLAAPAATPGISAEQAIAAAKADAGQEIVPAKALPGSTARQKEFSAGDEARLVYFQTLGGLRVAWRTLVWGDQLYQTVVDASNGRVLYRRSLSSNAGPVNASVWENYPGAAIGGTQHTVDISPWLTLTDRLRGNNAAVYSDLNDDDLRNAGEDTVPGAYAFTPFTNPPAVNSPCSALFPCSWNSSYPGGTFSWQTNRAQNAVQVFYFINKFHDHLAAAPIGFTAAAGNFEGGDPVVGQAIDGANTLCCVNGAPVGLPDSIHIDNANMSTPPDGFAPRMQMYLFNDPVANPPFIATHEDPFVQSNGGDEADVVYHEYTHGLSNRLVVDADGNSTLGNIQAGSMGEAWSDWYAADFLVNEGLFVDTPADGDLRIGDYVGAGEDLIRTQPIDCPVGSSSPKCHGTGGAGAGGYTYGDLGKIIGGPEVHADGEIWGETLWDLRAAIGSSKAESLVTRAMELAPSNPSYLDMRNSILQADLVARSGLKNTIWQVFAHRGMGWFAGSVDGDDTQPVENFQLPPANGSRRGLLFGVVRDADTRAPIVGARVAFGGHASGFPGDYAGVTNRAGLYTVNGIFLGTYPSVWASAPGYDRVVTTVSITGAVNLNWNLRRDWAALSGGGSIVDFNGPDYTPFGCGPSNAIDQSEGAGWGSDTDHDALVTGNVIPKFIVVKLPQPVTVSEIQVNPSNTCGDPGSSSTRGYRIEISSDGNSFTELTDGVFYAGNRARENTVFTGSQANVQYLKFWMLNPQVPNAASTACTSPATCGSDPDDNSNVAAHCGPGKDNGFGGCQFMDMSELKVYGRP